MRGDLGDSRRDFRRSDVFRHILTVSKRPLFSAFESEFNHRLFSQLLQRFSIGWRFPFSQCEKCDAPVHRAGIEIYEAQLLGNQPRRS
jgi:hypothetical protein